VTCVSTSSERVACAANTATGVVLMRSTGSAPCLLGKTWGYDQTSIWVSDGCGGEFVTGRAEVSATKSAVPRYLPNVGFLLFDGDKGQVYFRLFSYGRYLNQRNLDKSYVDAFGFRERIRLHSEVLSAQPLAPSGWRVEVRTANGTIARPRYDALVACSGNYWSPRVPAIPGEFEGETLHAQRYRDPDTPLATRGRRVAVVGSGNTGCELACEIAAAGAEAVFVCARSGVWIVPKRVAGRPAAETVPMMHPLDPVPAPLRALPRPAREWLFGRVMARAFRQRFAARMARFTALGLPPPPADPRDKRATICDPLLDALANALGPTVRAAADSRRQPVQSAVVVSEGIRSSALDRCQSRVAHLQRHQLHLAQCRCWCS